MRRQSRKLEHITYSLALPDGPGINRFTDFSFVHNCLPDLDWEDISVATTVAGITLQHPIIINAITGGAKDVRELNAQLAQLAMETNAAMAVGSQFAAIESVEVQDTYKIVRTINPDGVIFANLGAHASPRQAKQAVEMIGAQGIQIHLNVAQELVMAEGDRNFTGYLRNIADIIEAVDVPVIVKEVGCGIAYEQGIALAEIGVRAIDVGGVGGTNFLAIESARKQVELEKEFLEWGIPTAISATELREKIPKHIDIIVSGGIRTPLDIIKSLALGGAGVGIAAPFIKNIAKIGVLSTVESMQKTLTDMKKYMMLLGVNKVSELKTAPIVITGYSAQWLTARGIDIRKYALRSISE